MTFTFTVRILQQQRWDLRLWCLKKCQGIPEQKIWETSHWVKIPAESNILQNTFLWKFKLILIAVKISLIFLEIILTTESKYELLHGSLKCCLQIIFLKTTEWDHNFNRYRNKTSIILGEWMNILCTVIMHIIKNRVIFKYHQEREKVKRKDNYRTVNSSRTTLRNSVSILGTSWLDSIVDCLDAYLIMIEVGESWTVYKDFPQLIYSFIQQIFVELWSHSRYCARS